MSGSAGPTSACFGGVGCDGHDAVPRGLPWTFAWVLEDLGWGWVQPSCRVCAKDRDICEKNYVL